MRGRGCRRRSGATSSSSPCSACARSSWPSTRSISSSRARRRSRASKTEYRHFAAQVEAAAGRLRADLGDQRRQRPRRARRDPLVRGADAARSARRRRDRRGPPRSRSRCVCRCSGCSRPPPISAASPGRSSPVACVSATPSAFSRRAGISRVARIATPRRRSPGGLRRAVDHRHAGGRCRAHARRSDRRGRRSPPRSPISSRRRSSG